MLFDIQHTTDYRYTHPVSEAYLETRLTPPTRHDQTVVQHRIDVTPEAPFSHYHDYFGNTVSFYSMTLRHARLTLVNRIRIRTHPVILPAEALQIPVAEARQLFSSTLVDFFDYLEPSEVVPTGGESTQWVRKLLPPNRSLGEGLKELNSSIYQHFEYKTGSTDNSTPLVRVWKNRRGVCQDFAHIMLSILRTAGLPARYVCGYIESEAPVQKDQAGRRLVGSLATHAWVEVLTPGMNWVALDPTNNQWCGEQHVAMAFGRDFRDAAPVRGTFKGSTAQRMRVRVSMKRVSKEE